MFLAVSQLSVVDPRSWITGASAHLPLQAQTGLLNESCRSPYRKGVCFCAPSGLRLVLLTERAPS
jgi:hypothetical protein